MSGANERNGVSAGLRLATAEDDPAIAELIGACFPGNPKARLEVLRWQYRANPFGPAVSVVHEDEGRLVGHFTTFPMAGLLGGRPAMLGNAVDAAVAPSHQGRRLFTPLAAALYAACAEAGIGASYSFIANPAALRGVVRAGGREVGRLRTLVLATDERWLARRFHVPVAVASILRRAAFRTAGTRGRALEQAPEGLDELWSRTVAGGGMGNGVIRDGRWWRWRYGESPLGPYRFIEVRNGARLDAALVLVEREDFGGRFAYVLELLAADPEAAATAIATAAAELPGVAGLATQLAPGSPLERLARRAGLRPLPRRLQPKSTALVVVDHTGRLPATTRWQVAWGDQDHL